ncbi:MAG: hypothetical protein AAF960_26050 [Bacteroidota bacterium]
MASFSSAENQLVQLSNLFLKDSLTENRIEAAATFQQQLTETLSKPNSFNYPFENLTAVSIQYPADSTFRIFTWQLYVDKNEYQYGGVIQKNTLEPALFPLADKSSEVEQYDLEYDILSPENWYGALYFNLKEFDSPSGKKYLLFGFDGYEFFNKRKLVEVLHFDEAGQPVFGSPVFVKAEAGYEASTKNRLYIEYSAEVAAKVNYDHQLGLIMIDNLVAMRSPYRGVGNVNIPDGSYVGYELKEGVWQYVDKVFHFVSERPPAPNPILNNRTQKDIFGKANKKKRDKNLPFKN